jgi:Ca-activated chloride channel family protein
MNKQLLASLTLLEALAVAPPLHAEPVKLDLALGTPVLEANKRQTAFLKIGLTGTGLPDGKARAPINMAIVLDRSGSMAGDKMNKAKEASMMVLDRLEPADLVSVIAYDDTAEVLVPATHVVDKDSIRRRIDAIRPRGSTALFAGVSRGIEEVRKFLDQSHVNRVVLLSDGQANVGPSSPNELGRLGAATAKQGISITTIGLGLGYNEDLMTQLAIKSDGNHGFAENAADLARIFDFEVGDVLSVVAQEIAIKVALGEGVRPIRVLNRDAEIRGSSVIMGLNQLYKKQEKFFLLEVEVPPEAAGKTLAIAKVDISYAAGANTERSSATVNASFSASPKQIADATNRAVMVAAVEAVATENNRLAVNLRDQGKVEEAKKVLINNSSYLKTKGDEYDSPALRTYGTANETDSKNLDEQAWTRQRKSMRQQQHRNSVQQMW